MILSIDVTDWKAEADQSPIVLANAEDIVSAMLETKMKPLEAGRLATIFRELGKADQDILPSNKLNLQTGAAYAVSRMVTEQRTEVKINNKSHDIRRFVATVTTDEAGTVNDDASTLVEYSDPIAAERAIQYLLTNVTGRIRERFAIIAAGKGDLATVVDQLKTAIDDIAREFV